MHIKEIELRNFKSFGRKALIPLYKDFIVITGPNGSGKSNIVDALLFALCLSTSRAMRAERLPDLVYKGENGRSPDYAQVTVRLDNRSRTMPIDADEVEVSRKIKLNGDKYHALYYFNGKSCTQTELQDHLSKAGISPEGYNVVMQGDVTRIIEMTPVERRRIIDEIAGVAEFDEKKRKAIAELDVVRERIGRVDVILEEVAVQLSQLRVERDKALSYQAHRDEKRRMEAFLLLARLKESEYELAGLEKEYIALDQERVSLDQTLAIKRADLEAAEESLKSLTSEIDHKGEDERIAVRRRIEEIKGEIAREETRAEGCDREIAEVDKGQSACYMEMEKLKGEMDAVALGINDSEISLAGVRGEMEEQADVALSARNEIALADSRYSSLRDELSSISRLREESKASMADMVRERDRHLDLVRRNSQERDDLFARIAEAEEALTSGGREAGVIRADLDRLAGQSEVLERDRSDLEGARLKIRREIGELDRSLQKLQAEYARVEAQMRAIEERSGYSRSVEAIRSAIHRGILQGLHGTIADLGEVNPRYSIALEIAAGARLQSLVSETDEDASQGIEYLKRAQIGRATFLPLNRLDNGSLPQLPSSGGVIDFALNLVRFDKKYYPAFWYVFRDTLVVEDLAVARRMMGKYRMVTLEGDLVEKSGAMTGGHYRSRLRFAADESKRLVELSERIAASDGERSGLLDRLDRVEGEISRISHETGDLSKEIARLTFRLEECDLSRPRHEKAIEELRARLADVDAESLSARGRLDELESEIRILGDSVRELESQKADLERQMAGSRIPELSAQAEAAEVEVKRLEGRIKEIDASLVRQRLREESCAARLDELSKRRESLEGQKLDALVRKDAAIARMKDLAQAQEEMAIREKEIEAELRGLKGERGSLIERTIALQREIDRMERSLERIEARATAASGAATEIRSRVEQLRSDIQAAGVDPSEDPPASDVIAGKIKALEQAMADLEPVNMLAVEDYDRVDTRFKVLDGRRETLKRERDEIVRKLDKYDQMKKDAFLACFHEINANFKEVFAELSGGEGELILESHEEPLEGGMTIKARPAGKVFHRLEAMSGGEKSLTALSFIFAIQRFRPAPFYAMDEIDMFLDGANAEKVARLIKKISNAAQFIVVSLRRPMIQQSKYTVGVAMQEKSVSSVTGICLS